MNGKLTLGAFLAVLGGIFAVAGVSGDSEGAVAVAATINYSHLCLWLCGILIVAAAFCVGMAIYTKLYGDF